MKYQTENYASFLEEYEKYKGESWLEYVNKEPLPETLAAIKEAMDKGADYPMVPGFEIPYYKDATPEGWTREDITTAEDIGIHAYYPDEKPADDRVVFYVHGGGFMRGNEQWNRQNAITLALNLGLPTYCSKYRVVPENKYPAGLDDVENAWDYITENIGIAPEKIILAGESAGGNYIMALALRLKRKGKKLPGGLLCSSGALDMAYTGASYRYNIEIDPEFAGFDLKGFADNYTDEEDRMQPEISPVYGDLAGLPKTFFCADDMEIFVSDNIRAAKEMADKGIEVKCCISHKLIHAFIFEVYETAEAVEMLAKAKKFFEIA
ncbi:MAG: alpha/beta hydrolase [Clostridia bacterium]|nr:alpha/beta hydrolase [Clostridia bacterium]